MQDLKKKQIFRCLIIIIDANMRERLNEFLSDSNVPIFYQMHGVGTVRSDFLNLFGLGNPQKSITLCFIPKEQRELLLAEVNQALQLHRRGTGIAISIPLSGMQGWLYKLLDSAQPESAKKESERLTIKSQV